ncbi:MAG TPA: T9SS type A sorting domain-containing protein [Ignavibacteria bacterium]|nr:T9SS type A sorting domain-containing protein [Ignavibacteria bacterium]HMR41780.1 T9SS type A sorting domain-containing protein [Ignavibacteria bacterium]
MKNFKSKLFLAVLATLITFNFALSNDPASKLSIENLKNTSANSLEFDIYLLHTNPSESKFVYMLGQYLINFNSDIANGGELTYSIIGSGLPEASQPTKPSIDKNILRIAVNSIPPTDNLPEISSKAPGTLIAKVRLTTSAKSFADVPLNLNFRLGPENPYTKLSIFEDGKIREVPANAELTEDNNPAGNLVSSAVPAEYALLQNYPNPFNPETKINFDLPSSSDVKLSVYDITGKEIALLVNEKLEPGTYSFKWNGTGFASGMYFYRIQSGDFVQTRKMVLIK